MNLRPVLPHRAILRRPLWTARRHYAVQAPGNPTLEVFNRKTKYLQKERAGSNSEEGRKVDYLKDEVAFRLSERLLVCRIQRGNGIYPFQMSFSDFIAGVNIFLSLLYRI